MASEITLHVELNDQASELLRRTCENLEWYRKHLQEQAMMQTEREREAMKRRKDEAREQEQAENTEWYRKHLLSSDDAKEQVL